MRSYTHIAGGIIFTMLIMYILNIPVTAFYIFLAGTAAVIPDLLDYMLTEKHNRETHNIWVLVILMGLSLVNQIFIIIAAAYFSHLVLDLMTSHGVRLLFPFKKTRFVCMGEKYRIKTGTGREKALFFFLVILVVGGVLMNYQVFSLIDTATATQPTTMADNNTTNGSNAKTYINVQVQVDEGMSNKNISIKNSQNESNIIVREINQ
jgi:inner membrane protein